MKLSSHIKNMQLRLRQAFCRHKKLTEEKYVEDINGYPYVVEQYISCEKCGKVKHAEAYGALWVENWKDLTKGKV